MKGMIFVLISLCLLSIACSKENATDASLLGVWVDKNHPLDTLVVYRENGKNIIFDNSLAFRTPCCYVPNQKSNFLHQYLLKKDSIGFKYGNASHRDPYFFYSFRWIKYKEEFSMPYNGLRPYLSSIGTNTYVKVK